MFFKKKKENKTTQQHGKKASFWGASDRMICCKGIECEVNEFNITSNPKLHDGGYVATLEITAPDEEQGLFIHAFFSGHWSFAVSPSSDISDDLPEWEIIRAWGTINSHSETLEINCPPNSRVQAIERITTL